jgi:hypothetical protein
MSSIETWRSCAPRAGGRSDESRLCPTGCRWPSAALVAASGSARRAGTPRRGGRQPSEGAHSVNGPPGAGRWPCSPSPNTTAPMSVWPRCGRAWRRDGRRWCGGRVGQPTNRPMGCVATFASLTDGAGDRGTVGQPSLRGNQVLLVAGRLPHSDGHPRRSGIHRQGSAPLGRITAAVSADRRMQVITSTRIDSNDPTTAAQSHFRRLRHSAHRHHRRDITASGDR